MREELFQLVRWPVISRTEELMEQKKVENRNGKPNPVFLFIYALGIVVIVLACVFWKLFYNFIHEKEAAMREVRSIHSDTAYCQQFLAVAELLHGKERGREVSYGLIGKDKRDVRKYLSI